MIRQILAVSLLAVLLSACDDKKKDTSGAVTPADTTKKLRIAVIPKGTSHVFWQSVHAGANRAARELGIADPVWNGPPDEAQINDQINRVNNVQTAGVDAIVLAPINYEALDKTIEAAFAKMPVVIFDSGCKTEQYTAFVATDNFKGGQLAGEEMLRLLGPDGGDVGMVKVQPGGESTTQRENGFIEAIKKNAKVKLVFDQYGYSDRNKSMQAASAALVAHPDLKGFFGPNESSAFGILKAIQEKKLAGKIKFVGFDSSRELADGLAKGEIHALVLQDPIKMGYLSVKAAYAALKKQPVEKKQPIEPTLITTANMNQPAMHELLYPNLEKDLK
jgi:ribose transport system substrate-binding protein